MDKKVQKLYEQIDFLKKENGILKQLLAENGIIVPSEISDLKQSQVSANQSIDPIVVTDKLANKFFSYFWGRTDVFSKRSENKKTGKSGYYTQCENFWVYGLCPKVNGTSIKCSQCKYQKWKKLDIGDIKRHIEGKSDIGNDVIGIYPLFEDDTCRLLVFDFDNHNSFKSEEHKNDDWKEEVDALRRICILNNVPMIVERSRSGNGAHLWIFFQEPIPAITARKFGALLLDRGAESVNLKTFEYYDRMIPAQDELPAGGLGNLIALPLQGKALKNGNSAFVDSEWRPFNDQIGSLFSVEKLSLETVNTFIEQWSKPKLQNRNQIALIDNETPWDTDSFFKRDDVSGQLKMTLADRVYIATDNIAPRLQNRIRKLAAFSNPAYFKHNAMGISNYSTSRYIYIGDDEGGYICLPRALAEQIENHCRESDIGVVIDDKRNSGNEINVEFTGKLREKQIEAAEAMLSHENGIMYAATAFGKTVVCSYLIAALKTNALIILESSALIEQWKEALSSFLRIDEAFPEYYTKTGRKKTRKSLIGVIQGATDTSTGIIDIAMAGSLWKDGEYHPRLREYGLVIVDECHHSASETIRRILMKTTAKCIYGVSATPYREDGLERINYMLLGPVRFTYTAKEKTEEQGIPHYIVPRFTRTVYPHGKDKIDINKAYETIRDSKTRTEQILRDVKQCVEERRTPVILTRYTEHAQDIFQKAKGYADRVFLLTGRLSKKERNALWDEMKRVSDDETMIPIATGQFVGEGFDYPRLDTLIMATPVAWKGVVEQYAGRLSRDYPGKKSVMIYDYIDSNIPVSDRMYGKRLRAYKNMGYVLYSEKKDDQQYTNYIFSTDNYFEVLKQDISRAEKSIVISSPWLSRRKVYSLILLLQMKAESGVKITLMTYHPDVYRFGDPSNIIEMMDRLKEVGIHLEILFDDCRSFVVIDNNISWYGSMGVLSRDEPDESVMRLREPQIAEEILSLGFAEKEENDNYELPI